MNSADFNLKEHPHRRFNPLTREWVLVSPHRTQRPWQGQIEQVASVDRPAYDPSCYLCPTNSRAGGATNPDYNGIFVFENDFAALRHETPTGELIDEEGLIVAESEAGLCRVICFSPRHDLTLARMEEPELTKVVSTWAEQYQEIGRLPFIDYVQIFENRGEMMGASNPHPHGQIWAVSSLPNEIRKEQTAQHDHLQDRHSCLLCDYLALELKRTERIICQNEHFAALVPFWAIWPFETILISKRHLASLDQLNEEERAALGSLLKRLTTRYDNLFATSFPYSMGFHQQPTDGETHPEWHLHAHFYPPLLRSATVRKFMVGFELLGGPQRDLTAESAAEQLRALPEMHYLGYNTTADGRQGE
jgi:UDPglucose--hexose-1-phosphate uridylyltransferase